MGTDPKTTHVGANAVVYRLKLYRIAEAGSASVFSKYTKILRTGAKLFRMAGLSGSMVTGHIDKNLAVFCAPTQERRASSVAIPNIPLIHNFLNILCKSIPIDRRTRP